MKRAILAIIAVFVTWCIVDTIVHWIILRTAYMDTAELWRNPGEMKTYLMYITSISMAIAFVAVYAWLVSEKGVKTGLWYGLILGLGSGIARGYGSYAVMPIPYSMAFTWFIGAAVDFTLAGLITGLIVRKKG